MSNSEVRICKDEPIDVTIEKLELYESCTCRLVTTIIFIQSKGLAIETMYHRQHATQQHTLYLYNVHSFISLILYKLQLFPT